MSFNKESIYYKTVIGDVDDEPLLGVYYLIEFERPNLMLKPFHCLICDKPLDASNLKNHLISNLHRINYLSNSFPSILKFLQRDYRFVIDQLHCMKALTKVSKNLEYFLTAQQPQVFKYFHFDIYKDKIFAELKRNDELNEKNFDSIKFILYDATEMNIDDFSLYDSNDSGNLIDEYHNQLSVVVENIKIAYREYRNRPESHPQYEAEWNKFIQWTKVKRDDDDKLLSKWQECWMIKVEEFKQTEILDAKKAIMQRLELRVDELNRFYDAMVDNIFTGVKEENHQFKSDGESDSDYGKDYLESCIRTPNYRSKPKPKRCRITELHKKNDNDLLDPDNFKNDAPGTVFIICRHILAIEREVGILIRGIRSIYLDSAKMEKEKASSSEILLHNEDNFFLFNAIRDKMRKTVNDRKFDCWKIKGVQRTIQQLTTMLSDTAHRIKDLDEKYNNLVKKIKIPSLCDDDDRDDEEKMEVAKTLSSFLAKQGKSYDYDDLKYFVDVLMKENS